VTGYFEENFMKIIKYWQIVAVLLIFALIMPLTGCFSILNEILNELTDDDDVTPSPHQEEIVIPPDIVFDAEQRDYRVRPKGNGEDVVTLMIYLCGSDLESQGAAATEDLIEILNANISDNLNIIVETGGADEWWNTYVNPNTNERWKLADGDMHFLQDVGRRDMSKADTLSDFISFCATNFPADRYMLLLWDHGGGTVGGFAYDERYPGYDMMPISEINRALYNAGVVFDMIGFDSCLMSTVETAFMIEKHADYLIASQRIEPGEGWYYTPWINALSQNTSIPTTELGKVIIDSYIEESRHGYYGDELTLSVIDLTYIPVLLASLYKFFDETEGNLINDRTFIHTSQALSANRAMSDNYDLVDLALLIGNMNGSDEVMSILDLCVAYNRTTIADHNGLCLYFPYNDLHKVSSALDVYQHIGIHESYQRFIVTFANIMVGGLVYSEGGTDNPLGGEGFDASDWLDLFWVDEQLFNEWDDFYEEYSYDGSELEIYRKGDDFVLSLSEDDWNLVTSILQRVFLDDGGGYIDLGSDAMYTFDADGDLLIEFDNTWVALDGELICFYTHTEEWGDDFWFTYGVAPVMYNNREAEIVIRWDDHNPYGYVLGWRYTLDGSGSQRGLFGFENGMRFEIICDYYTYDGDFLGQYYWGGLTINGPITVSYEDVGDADVLVYYELFDIYRNTYWTEAIIYSYNW